MQEWTVGLLDVKEEHLDIVQIEISKEHTEMFKDTKQNFDEEVIVPGKESMFDSHFWHY